jgi:hypothetical protein
LLWEILFSWPPYTKQAAEHAVKLASSVLVCLQRCDFRRQREGEVRSRKRLTGRTKLDDEHPVFGGVAWAQYINWQIKRTICAVQAKPSLT